MNNADTQPEQEAALDRFDDHINGLREAIAEYRLHIEKERDELRVENKRLEEAVEHLEYAYDSSTTTVTNMAGDIYDLRTAADHAIRELSKLADGHPIEVSNAMAVLDDVLEGLGLPESLKLNTQSRIGTQVTWTTIERAKRYGEVIDTEGLLLVVKTSDGKVLKIAHDIVKRCGND